ncbi:Collagenase-like protease, PrtC family [Pontibaca methylaminivorans]|uniref:Ubiquinone biosynthesis protein UbiV n=2 Tax=Pontibaca methylaminivorans TaxID=515897 RepID=A0A1R3WII7_9RHOB|nr:Collagenase-like protease, PrtC family [Pontibaca methylaminivorans]
MTMTRSLTLGPIPFHWPAEDKLDFYASIADEAPVDTVYLGEVICSKRAPFFERHYAEVADRLERGGKHVVFSSLAEVMTRRERQMMAGFCEIDEHEIEINNNSGLFHMNGRAHRIGPLLNVYNAETLVYLAERGATHFALPVELPRSSVAQLAEVAAQRGAGIEVQVFGRASLAVSARCYHARAHGRTKDNCQFVCEEDPDGMPLRTLVDQPFLRVNGIQTMSESYVNLIEDLEDLAAHGVTHYRLVPQVTDMVAVARAFRDVLDGTQSAAEGAARIDALGIAAPFSNGFWYARPGFQRIRAPE